MLNKSKLFLALITLGASKILLAAEGPVTTLNTIVLTAQSDELGSELLGKSLNVSNQFIDTSKLKQRSTTLGDALGTELGIHSNQYGGGASTPIIRGQEGKRIKVLQNNADVLDMSNMSPDHAVTVEPSLAKSIEIIRGASTLLYSSNSAAGVVNVIDYKIPTQMPQDGLEGNTTLRFNTGSNEKLTTAGVTVGLSPHVALRAEGLYRNAGNYKTPHYQSSSYNSLEDLENQNSIYKNLKYLPESWAESRVGTLGLSWIDDNTYLGVSYTHRHDEYGLPAHSHLYEGCGASAIGIDSRISGLKNYLLYYPQLMDEQDINYINPRPDCHQHNHIHETNFSHNAPYIDLNTRRYDVRGEFTQPFTGIDKIRTSLSYIDYFHNELEGDKITNFFKNTGKVGRIELSHQPLGELTGILGLQYLEQDNSALSPVHSQEGHTTYLDNQQLLNRNVTKNFSVFGLEKYNWNDFTFELGARIEKQKVSMDYDIEKIKDSMKPWPNKYNSPYVEKNNKIRAQNLKSILEAVQPNKETAFSYAGTVHWRFAPNYILSLTGTHQERLPNAQEMYTHGMHLATNSFEIGNRFLRKEKSNNLEISLAYKDDLLDYQISTYYYDFDNYIYLQTLNEVLGTTKVRDQHTLRINHYSQSAANFYGLEGNIGYQFNSVYHGSLFGDYVKGRLTNLPDAVIAYDIWNREPTLAPQKDRYTPRLPPARLGTRLKADFDESLKGE
ncbi:TonB-dependent receptor ZnuD2, partial [Acinetobacter baumannii]